MKKLFATASLAVAILLAPALAFGQVAPVKQEPPHPADAGLTIGDCLAILQGLNALDGRTVVLKAGKPDEQSAMVAYDFGNAGLRLAIARNISTLSAVQREAQAVQQKIFGEVSKGDGEIKTGSKEMVEYDRQLRQLTARPCPVALQRIGAADLKLEKNDIPGSVLGAIDRILDR